MSEVKQTKAGDGSSAVPPAATVPLVDETALKRVVSKRAAQLLGISVFFDCLGEEPVEYTRPILAFVCAEATQLEELLDAYGAGANSEWFIFREMVASAKAFSDVAYRLIHIQHSLPRYKLLPIAQDFAGDLPKALAFVTEILRCVLLRMVPVAEGLQLALPELIPTTDSFSDVLPPGALPGDRRTRHTATAEERAVHLATSFLEAAADSDFLHVTTETPPEEYANLIPDPIGEESLRQVEYKFHNLQSLYDTYISDSDTEETDANLPTLRGHVSVIFHLLEISVLLVHFYERHLMLSATDESIRDECPIDFDPFLTRTVDFSIVYACRYLYSARELCHAILRRHATVGTIEVPVPAYRGFHVRPSTLVSAIVRHYGSDVTMELDGETYDAGKAIALFRANERINAWKRRQITGEVAQTAAISESREDEDLGIAVRRIVLDLAQRNQVVIYEHPLPVKSARRARDLPFEEQILNEINRLLVAGKIDVRGEVRVRFTGDERVLNDLKILAESGYCEDAFGNNTPIPAELSYLKR
ncbi:MAG: hypothetical protein HN742_43260 [Lentisphaerae bacterium]|jgi:phosphotransferase system HPr-like phosphotransfer protein|nr:hypothetical protein [Lentisphaerota bacterium]MBT4820940.1 hypothetical protein [Lentisphaerota bacterium]MBT5609080.1 hypothetical protein [Lentisphaerota bacterium]MBT7057273.1 hypothetical protein [Lentisphaerota bacterium]MBT7848758.1 hypothetical protein [Lentisphaerota bacterium]